MISVQHNMLAENANRQLNVNTNKNAKIAEKLSSGYQINRAADDASGLAISEKMRRQVRGLNQAAENIKDGIGYVQTAEGALNEVQDMLQRINQLAVQAANGTNTVSDRAYINSEVQALKEEMTRIFSTTTFNEQRIWEPEETLVTVGGEVGKDDSGITWVTEDAVTFNGSDTNLADIGGVTNANCGVLAVGSYRVEADDSGILVKWTGYDGNAYSTETVPWDEIDIDANGVYSFKMEDYFGTKDGTNKLYTYNADTKEYDPVFINMVSFTVNPYVTDKIKEDVTYRQYIIDSINGATMPSSPSASMSVDDDDCKNISSKANSEGISVTSPYLYYEAAYLSWANGKGDGYNFNTTEDKDFIEPNLPDPPSMITGNLMSDPIQDGDRNGVWSFSFKMQGIGTVTATSSSMYFFSKDSELYKTEDERVWWYYDEYHRKTQTGIRVQSGTLDTLIDGLTGSRGVISKDKGGSTDTGKGSISLNFTITPDNKDLTYGKDMPLTRIGTFSINIPVDFDDDRDTILGNIKSTLDSLTVLEFARSGDSAYMYRLGGTRVPIQVPVYPDDYVPGDNDDNGNNGYEYIRYTDRKYFWVQAGAEAGQHIDIDYESLSLRALGMQDTDTLTAESASRAIDEVKGALQVVSDQRSLFGAYQNRLEHAYNINKNVEENTQASESLIRDTDIADAMMEYSINNILLQAGTSMLTQANQSSQLILQLLG